MIKKIAKSKRNRFKKKVRNLRAEYEAECTPCERKRRSELHMKKRIAQRLDLKGPDAFRDLIFYIDLMIKSGIAILVGESRGNYHYNVPIGDSEYRVIFDPNMDVYKTIWDIAEEMPESAHT